MLNNVNSFKVKHKAGHLSYTEDPNGYKSLMAQSHSSNNFTSWSVSVSIFYCIILFLLLLLLTTAGS